MSRFTVALIASLCLVGSAHAQPKTAPGPGAAGTPGAPVQQVTEAQKAATSTPPAAADSCEAKAVGKDGKPLAGAAKASFMKKCDADDAAATKACEAKAIDKNGKALAGAAKTASVKKCVADSKKG